VSNNWTDLIELLLRAGMEFSAGLKDAEVERAEATYGFQFPADLRDFVQTAAPMYYDWHSENDARIREMMAWPLEGMLFDIENNVFSLSEWGPRPESLEDAKAIARDLVAQAPRLIPIYAHRMMPDCPNEAGNPVFSVHQTDVIYYGFDLDDYFRHEFNLPGRKPWPAEVRPIEFWDIERFQDIRWRE